MSIILEVTLPWNPIPKGRPRTGNGTTYTPPRTRQAEKDVIIFIRRALKGQRPVSNPVGLKVKFFCATRNRVDGDNLLKLITDAMNGIVYLDDSQIEEWSCRIYRGVGQREARTEIIVYRLKDPSDTPVSLTPVPHSPKSARVTWRPVNA